MAAATSAINTPKRAGIILTALPIEANTNVFVGTMAARNAAGNIVPASDTAALNVLGRFTGVTETTLTPDLIVGSDAINNPGAAGAIVGNVERGVFEWNNSIAHPITLAMIGEVAYVEDDNTVCSGAGSANKIVAGVITSLSPDGTKVGIDTLRRSSAGIALTSAQNATAAAVDLASAETLANSLKASYNQLQADVATLLSILG